MDGPATPGIGFAMGVERLLIEAEAQGKLPEKPKHVKLYIAAMSDASKKVSSKLCYDLRLEGIGCEIDLSGRSFRAQMKYAGKQEIPFLTVIGDDELANGEVKIKDMASGEETPVKLDGFVKYCLDNLV